MSETMAKTPAELFEFLDSLAIAHSTTYHAPVFTVAESESLRDEIPGGHTKNLFLKDNGGAFWLVTVPSDARVDLKALPAAIGSKRVSFGKAEDMQRLLGIVPGSVTPLAAINAPPGSIAVVVDEALAAADIAVVVTAHPELDYANIASRVPRLLDLRGVTRGIDAAGVERL